MSTYEDKSHNLNDIEVHIQQIGERMVSCTCECEGISRDTEKGVIPRCLRLEIEGRSLSFGCVIVGLNPGHAKEAERKYYRRCGNAYHNVIEYWDLRIAGRLYYKSLRRLVGQLGFMGPILWTELVKCESDGNRRPLPVQTVRRCTESFLHEELRHIPHNWLIIGVGRHAYETLAYRLPDRVVLGVPHPVSAFPKFKEGIYQPGLDPRVKQIHDKVCSNGSQEAVWLRDLLSEPAVSLSLPV